VLDGVRKEPEFIGVRPFRSNTGWRGSQVVRHGSAKAAFVGSIPTLASNFKLHFCNELQNPEEASASESASEIITGIPVSENPGSTRQSLGMTGFAARKV
jgi:hypothetical protein